MNYIVFDLEWNQPYQIDLGLMRKVKYPITGEIIQIGAVKLNEKLQIIDQFNTWIRPTYLGTMHQQVEKLTGIHMDELLLVGIPFANGYRNFMEWCGEDSAFITWGPDDMHMLQENIAFSNSQLHANHPWYDGQYIFAREVLGNVQQTSLKGAMKHYNLSEDGLQAHNGLHDAIFTAHICQRMPLKRGIENYEAYGKTVYQSLYPLVRYLFNVYENFKFQPRIYPNSRIGSARCPHCGSHLVKEPIISIGRGRYLMLAQCYKHGDFAVHWYIGKNKAKGGEVRFFIAKTITDAPEGLKSLYRHKLFERHNDE